jgi:hypothetical protein
MCRVLSSGCRVSLCGQGRPSQPTYSKPAIGILACTPRLCRCRMCMQLKCTQGACLGHMYHPEHTSNLVYSDILTVAWAKINIHRVTLQTGAIDQVAGCWWTRWVLAAKMIVAAAPFSLLSHVVQHFGVQPASSRARQAVLMTHDEILRFKPLSNGLYGCQCGHHLGCRLACWGSHGLTAGASCCHGCSELQWNNGGKRQRTLGGCEVMPVQ